MSSGNADGRAHKSCNSARSVANERVGFPVVEHSMYIDLFFSECKDS